MVATRRRRPASGHRFTEEQRIRYRIAESMLEPAVFDNRKLLGRELAILKQLMEAYPVIGFWKEHLKPALALESFLYFKGQLGAAQLKGEWDRYLYYQTECQRTERQAAGQPSRVDIESSTPMIEPPAPPIVRKQSAASWADSGDE